MMRAGACGPTCACCYPDLADACERFKDDDVCDAECAGETGRAGGSLMGTEADGTLSKVGTIDSCDTAVEALPLEPSRLHVLL